MSMVLEVTREEIEKMTPQQYVFFLAQVGRGERKIVGGYRA